MNEMERGVEHVDGPSVEVGGVEMRHPTLRHHGQALVDGPGDVRADLGDGRWRWWRDGRVPACDVAALTVEDERGRPTVPGAIAHDEAARRIEDLTGGPVAGDPHRQRNLADHRTHHSVTAVERGDVRAVV